MVDASTATLHVNIEKFSELSKESRVHNFYDANLIGPM